MSLQEHYPADSPLELGCGVEIRWSRRYGAADDAEYCGGLLSHPKPENPSGRCEGSFFIKGSGMDGKAEWDVLSEQPLTLAPSFLCHCGFHGWVRDGKWVSA